VFWASGVCRKGLVICKDGVFMWDFWNFKVIPSTKTILIAQVGSCHTSVLGYECLQKRDGYLQKIFSCKTFGISKSFQAQKPF
jgi:hypothetical protein